MRAIWKEENLVQKWLDIELALVEALSEQRIIPIKDKEKIKKLSDVRYLDVNSIKEITKETRHIISGFVKSFKKICGASGEYYHLGATTQDILDTSLTLLMKESYTLIVEDLLILQDTLMDLAEKHKETVMAGRSQGQQGNPVTFGFKMAIWVSEIQEHLERLLELEKRSFFLTLTGAMGTSASFHMLLGSTEATEKLQQTVSSLLHVKYSKIDLHHRTDKYADMLNQLALISSSLGEFGLELRDLQKTEINELAENVESDIDGSSTMPHKTNPEPSHWLEGLAKIARSNALAMMDIQMQHERDATRTAVEFSCISESFLVTHNSIRTLANVLKNVYVNESKMKENLNLTKGLNMSEAMMFHLFIKTGEKLEAHQIIKECAQKVKEGDIHFEVSLMEHPTIQRHFTLKDIQDILKPENYLGTIQKQMDDICIEVKKGRIRFEKLRK